MFRGIYQSGYISLLYSLNSKPLELWDSQASRGHIQSTKDSELQSEVLELSGENISQVFITCPSQRSTSLGIKLSHFMMQVKPLPRPNGAVNGRVIKHFSFELVVRDDSPQVRHIRISTFQKEVVLTEDITCLPLKLNLGWNMITMDLTSLVRKLYKTNFQQVERVTVHATCRLRRLLFSENPIASDKALPNEFKLYTP